jgi:hypothetical protein
MTCFAIESVLKWHSISEGLGGRTRDAWKFTITHCLSTTTDLTRVTAADDQQKHGYEALVFPA